MSDKSEHEPIDWKTHGVKVLPGDQLDPNTAQTAGMDRAAAINLARVGAQKIWAGTVKIHTNAKTGAHHHGHLESVIYVLKGRARMRWGDHLEYVAEAGPGDFIFVPPYVGLPHFPCLPRPLLTYNTLKTHQDFAKCFAGKYVAGKSRDRSRFTLRYQWASAHLMFLRARKVRQTHLN